MTVSQDPIGILTISGANSYTGGTTIDRGTVVMGSAKAFGSATANLVNYGTLDLSGHNLTVGQLLLGNDHHAGNIVNGPDMATLTTNSKADSLITGDLSGAIIFVKSGTGTLTSTSTGSDYYGGFVLNAGAVNINASRAIGAGPLTIAGVSTLDNTSGNPVNLTNNNPQNWNANFTFKGGSDLNMGKGAVLMNATRTVTVNAGALTVGGAIAGKSASAGLTKTGLGTLVLTGNNTYAGTTTISAGTLQIGNEGNTGSLASAKIVNNGTLIFERQDTFAYDGIISGTGSVKTTGVGTLTLTGNNTYTGGTIISNGRLQVGSPNALGKGDVTLEDMMFTSNTLSTNGIQHQINVNGNLSWGSANTIALNLAASEWVNITGALSSDGGVLDFDFGDLPADPGQFLILSAAKGFGSITEADFSFTTNSSDLTGSFSIIGNNLFFTDEVIISGGGGSADGLVDQASPFDYSSSTGGNFSLQVTPVPEPGTWLLLGMGTMGLFLLRRYRAA